VFERQSNSTMLRGAHTATRTIILRYPAEWKSAAEAFSPSPPFRYKSSIAAGALNEKVRADAWGEKVRNDLTTTDYRTNPPDPSENRRAAGRRRAGRLSRRGRHRARGGSRTANGRGEGRTPLLAPGGGHVLRTPSIHLARSMALSVQEMDNTALWCLAALDVRAARAEVLRRHIMCVDDCDYSAACRKFDEIREYNRRGLFSHTIPYKVGIVVPIVAAISSIPLCFHLPTVAYFNEFYVTSDVPEPKDLETWLEVGSWAWNWMEPPLGQISFVLLCMQFARNRLQNIGMKPYGAKIKERRAERLVQQFPQYDRQVLSEYSKSESYY